MCAPLILASYGLLRSRSLGSPCNLSLQVENCVTSPKSSCTGGHFNMSISIMKSEFIIIVSPQFSPLYITELQPHRHFYYSVSVFNFNTWFTRGCSWSKVTHHAVTCHVPVLDSPMPLELVADEQPALDGKWGQYFLQSVYRVHCMLPGLPCTSHQVWAHEHKIGCQR